MSLNPRAVALQGIGFGARFTAVQGFTPYAPLTQYEPKQGGGPGRHHFLDKTSRNSDSRAYDPDRVAQRLEAIVIAGKTYDPLDPSLLEVIEAEARRPEPEGVPELVRQDRKLSRSFKVMTESQIIEVPLFRAMLNEMPNLAAALNLDMEAYAAKVEQELKEERRRILMLLSASDWP